MCFIKFEEKMKKAIIITVSLLFCLCAESDAQSLGKSLGLYIFPTKDQAADVISSDDASCFEWAKQQSGYDPLNPPEVSGADVDTGPDGAMIRGWRRWKGRCYWSSSWWLTR
jgi:hypothetical protein